MSAEGQTVYHEMQLHDRQMAVWNIVKDAPFDRTTIIGYGGALGGGKEVDINELIPTPNGWVKNGDLKDGDEIFDERGVRTRVLKAHPIDLRPESYRLTFDDGSVIDACADHLWHTFTHAELVARTRRSDRFRAARRLTRPSRATGSRGAYVTALMTESNKAFPPPTLPPPTGGIRTTREIAETLLTPNGHQTNHAIPVAKALVLPEADLPLEPYLLGVWLGDGTTVSGQVTSMDDEIWDAFEEAGFELGKPQTKPNNRSKSVTVLGLHEFLREAGVLGNKHIPQSYLRASITQRLELLQGLMDTDGTVESSGSVSFCTTKKALAEGVHELIVSLGWKARIIERRATLYGKDCGAKYGIKWTPDKYVFKLERKRARQKLGTRQTLHFRYIVGCERIDPKPMRCITVENESGLYLVGKSMIPTHNTALIVFMAQRLALDFPGNLILVARKDFTDLHDTTMKLFDETCPPPYLSGPYGKNGRNDQWNWRRLRKANWPPEIYSEVRFRGLHDVGSVGSSEYGAVLLDEASEIDKDVVMYTIARLRHNPPVRVRTAPAYKGIKRVFLAASNPFPGWYRDWFHLRKLDEDLLKKVGSGGVHFVPALAKDNKYLPETYVEEQLALHAGDTDFIHRMLEGRWDAFEGMIYKNFNPLWHEWQYREPADGEYRRVVGGLDFGMEMTGSHNTAGIVALVLNSGRLLRVAEFAENGPKVHERLLTWMLAQQARWCNAKTNGKIQWVADRSQSVGVSTWKNMGFDIRESKGGRDSVEAGIQAVSARLERDPSGIPGSFYLPQLTRFKEEMESYHRDENGKVVKLHDDVISADRYMHELLDTYVGDPGKLGLYLPRVG